ncbi:MAG: hypothetical protein C0594_08380 [Marinilabiliales bacterium]|nr:MAG: hypothetical protein C0594_08380 [Marinilabiliales bacterium]
MLNKNCTVCGKEFDQPRKNKLYCSDSCKQKAHTLNKKRLENELLGESKQERIKEPLYSFKFSEFQATKDIINTIETFCFVRKNIVGNFNPIYFKEYVEALQRNGFFDELEWEESKLNKEYNQFKLMYHSGLVKIEFED